MDRLKHLLCENFAKTLYTQLGFAYHSFFFKKGLIPLWNSNSQHFLRMQLNDRSWTKVSMRNVVGITSRLQEIIEQAKVIIIILGLPHVSTRVSTQSKHILVWPHRPLHDQLTRCSQREKLIHSRRGKIRFRQIAWIVFFLILFTLFGKRLSPENVRTLMRFVIVWCKYCEIEHANSGDFNEKRI